MLVLSPSVVPSLNTPLLPTYGPNTVRVVPARAPTVDTVPPLVRLVTSELPVTDQDVPSRSVRLVTEREAASVSAAPVRVDASAVRLSTPPLTVCTSAAPPLSDESTNSAFSVVASVRMPAPCSDLSVLRVTTAVPGLASVAIRTAARSAADPAPVATMLLPSARVTRVPP